jgi:hypothetical protein
LYNIIDGSKEKMGLERMKADIKAMRNKEMVSYEAFRIFNVPQKHHSLMLKSGRKAQVKQ